jgi:hypothetical protein
VAEDGSLAAKVFGVGYPAPAELVPLRRENLGLLMDHLHSRLGQPFTVEIIEADGSKTFGTVDLPGLARTQDPPAQGPASVRGAGSSAVDDAVGPGRVEGAAPGPSHAAHPVAAPAGVIVGAEGFLPGEETLLAYVAAPLAADHTGAAQTVIPAEVLDWLPTGEVILFGRRSGTIAVRQPGSRR